MSSDDAVRLDDVVAGVDRLFARRADEGRAPSAAYGVFTPEGLVHTGGYGSLGTADDGAQELAPTPDTPYRIASCTKSFTATAVLALRDAGALSLDQPVTEFVPAFAAVRLPSADAPLPTLRHLLTMSGGLPTDDPWGDRQESITDDELDALLGRGLTFDSVPGTRFAYSNLGYALLGRVVSVVAERPYRSVVEETILAPLGLSSTGFERPATGYATGHRRLDDEWQPLPFSGPGGFSSIGGLFSTVTDLSRWARFLASAWVPGRAGDADGILSRASRRELQQMHRYAPAVSAAAGEPVGYGFGLFAEESGGLGTIVSHSGGYPGFSAHMRWHAASGIGMVAFENATYAQVSVPTASALRGLLLEIGAAPVPRVWPEVRKAQAVVDAAVRDGAFSAELLELVSENVDLDVPLEHRAATWTEAAAAVGPLDAADHTDVLSTDVDTAAGEESQAPSHIVWRIPAERGRLRVEVRLTPEAPPRVQTLTVRAER